MSKKKSDLTSTKTEQRLSDELAKLKIHVNQVIDKQNQALTILSRIGCSGAADIEEAANAIVVKFEQLHNDYNILEKEMR